MKNDNIVVVEKKNTVWKVLGILLAIAALCAAAVVIYQKFFKKKQTDICEADALEEMADEELFSADADAVIDDAEEMA